MKHMETISSELSKSVSAVKATSTQEGDCKPEWLTAPVPWSWWKAHLHNYPDSLDINTQTTAIELGCERLAMEPLFRLRSEWLNFLESSTNRFWSVLTIADICRKVPGGRSILDFSRFTEGVWGFRAKYCVNSDKSRYYIGVVLFFFLFE